MIAEDRMTPAGLAAFEQRESYGKAFSKIKKEASPRLSKTSREALEANPDAWKNFNALAPGYRKQYILWIETAKRPETRKKRLNEAIGLLQENRKLGMK